MSSFAVVIINYNTCDLLRSCLKSVRSENPLQVVVVDNASSDGSAEMVRSEYPQVTLLANRRNSGYGTASNQGIAACAAKFILLLNGDTLLRPGTLRALAAYLDSNPRTGIVGPRLVNPDGTLQASCYPFPTPVNIFLVSTTLCVLIKYLPVFRKHFLPTWEHNSARAVPWVKGAALAIRREAFEAVGGFDQSFFMYFEETDLSFRLGAAGWETHFAPVTEVIHAGEASTQQRRPAMMVEYYSSAVLFYRRHYSTWRLRIFIALMRTIELIRLVHNGARLLVTLDSGRWSRIAGDIRVHRHLFLNYWRQDRKPPRRIP